MRIVPISFDDILNQESMRLEIKPDYSEYSLDQIIRTISAYANDLYNINGGYIIIGFEENQGKPVLPPIGIHKISPDDYQKKIIEKCHTIRPNYFPIIEPVKYQNQDILVIWCPASDNRPHEAPNECTKKNSDYHYFVRISSTTKKADAQLRQELIEQTAKIPFDDRKNQQVSYEQIDHNLVLSYLSDIRSNIINEENSVNKLDLYERLGIVKRNNGSFLPTNCGLLLFSKRPDEYFKGAKIELTQIGNDGNTIEDKVFVGPLNHQINQILEYLNNLNTQLVEKIPQKAEAEKSISFPYEAMEEAIVNAIFHRDYQNPEPTKIYLYPDKMEIWSYPGPASALKIADFQSSGPVKKVPNRNRRLGEFLKELRLVEARYTGIPKIKSSMKRNGSPDPEFDFDEERTYFCVTLPAHPSFVIITILRECSLLWYTGEKTEAINKLNKAINDFPNLDSLHSQLIEYYLLQNETHKAIETYQHLLQSEKHHVLQSTLSIVNYYINNNDFSNARKYLSNIKKSDANTELLIELAIQYKRLGDYQKSHQVFRSIEDSIHNNARALHEYAQTKIQLSQEAHKDKKHSISDTLKKEALELLHRVIAISDDNSRKAWCWYDIARVSKWLRLNRSQILDAIIKAKELLPTEQRFENWYRQNFKN